MRTIGNILWFVFGGFFMGLAWWSMGVLAYITIVGIPWARACFMIGTFSFFPFGKSVVSRKELTHKDDIGTGFFGVLGNIIWFVFIGIWLAIAHLTLTFTYFITIIGIPFGLQHLKLAKMALFPIGKTIITR